MEVPRTPDVMLKCDGPRCLAIPTKAPRVYVPCTDGQHHIPLTLAFPHISYCEKCWNEHMKLDDLLTDKAKARFEELGRKLWPHGIKPDFDAALVQPIDVYSAEYGAYLERLGFKVDGLGFSFHQRVDRRRLPGRFYL